MRDYVQNLRILITPYAVGSGIAFLASFGDRQFTSMPICPALDNNLKYCLRIISCLLKHAIKVGHQYHLPVWLTEWQRLRPGGNGWGRKEISHAARFPVYASLAAIVHQYPIGNFFWSLMIKRAYLPPQRKQGTVNGLFWSNGSVWSLLDARAIANDPVLELPEQHSLPPGYLSYLKKNANGAKSH